VQYGIRVIEPTPSDYERLTVTTAAVSQLDTALTADAKAVFITVETNSIRYRIDGEDPDASNGHLVYATQNIWFENPAAIRQFRAIGIGGTATLVVSYYR